MNGTERTWKGALDGLRVFIVRAGPVDFDKRTLQTARLLTHAGAKVTVGSINREQRTWIDSAGSVVREYWPGDPSTHPVWAVRVAGNLRRMWRQSRLLVRMVAESDVDIVHCMNLDGLLAAWMGAHGRPVVYDSWEHFPSTGKPKRRVRLWWLIKERFVIRRCSAVITVSEPIAEDLARRYRIPVPTVIYNGAVSVVGEPSPVHTPLRVLHLGKFFMDRGLQDVVRAAASVPGIELTLQGWGEAEPQLRALIDELSAADRIRIAMPCSPDEVVECASRHDVGVINISPETDSLRWSAANKLFEYMGAALAVLAPELPVMARIIGDADCGMTFMADSGDSLRAALSEIVEHRERVAVWKANAAKAAHAYTWDAQAPTLIGLYESVRDAGARLDAEV